MQRFLGAVIIILVTFYTAMIYGSYAFALLGFAQAFFVVLSFVLLLYDAFHLKLWLEIPITMAEQGQELTIALRGENRSVFGSSKVRCRVILENSLIHKKQKKWLWLEFGGERSSKSEYQIQLLRGGGYEITLDKMRVYGMGGIFYLRRRLRQSSSIEVIPKMRQIPVKLTEGVLHFFGEAEVYDELRGGSDPGETFQIREFQDGDRIQSIHWKLSARTDDLMVRELGRPKACAVAFLIENGEAWKNTEALSVAASISFSLMDAGCPHYMAWQSRQEQNVVRIRVDNEESFYLFLAHFLREGSSRQVQSISELYEQRYGAELLLHRLLLKQDGSLYLDQKLLAEPIGKWDYLASLQELEIIL